MTHEIKCKLIHSFWYTLFFWACPFGSGYSLLHLATLRRIRCYPSRKEKMLILNTLHKTQNKDNSQLFSRSQDAKRGRLENTSEGGWSENVSDGGLFFILL